VLKSLNYQIRKSEASSRRKRKFGDCSIASTTNRAPCKKIGFSLEEFLIALLFIRPKRAPKCFQSEFAYESRPAAGWRGSRLIWNQSALVVSLKCVARQALRCGAIRFDEQR